MECPLKKRFSFEKFFAFLQSKKEMLLRWPIFELNIKKRSKTYVLQHIQPAKKGLSPIIASVLLIVFSAVIAAIVGSWAMNYTQNQLVNLEVCKDINIEFLEINYSSSSKEGSFKIQNTGPTIDKYDIYVFANNKEEKVKEITTPLKKLEKKTIVFETELENVKGIKIEIPKCLGKSFVSFID